MSFADHRVALFDLDGTLVDSVPLIIASYQHALTTVLGRPGDEAVVRSWIGRPLIDAFVEVSPEHAQELFDCYSAWNLAHTADSLRAFPGVAELLTDLVADGVRVGVATSKRRSSADLALRIGGLDGLVKVEAALEDTTEHKPAAAPIHLALARLGSSPAHAVYVGDAVVDIHAARAAGCGAIAVTWGAASRDELVAAGPDVLVDDLAGLRAALHSALLVPAGDLRP